MNAIFKFFKQIGLLLVVGLLCSSCTKVFLPTLESNPWQVVPLPTAVTLSDVAFVNADHGWLVGKDSTLLETFDSGKTWQPRTLDLDQQSYTFNSVSFSGEEGWVAGQPSILLHTTDGGKSWSNVPLSDKLPGSPRLITALGTKAAELTTDIGAIYRTQDAGRTWQALVQQAVGVVRNITRSSDGKYVAVSSRGNFYSTWQPGQDAWEQFNRTSSRRLQSMGYSIDGGLWLLARGGIVQFSTDDLSEWGEPITPEFATSWGLLDLAYRTPTEVWVAGGSGNLLCSLDGGKTWLKDKAVENVPANFYKVVFITPEQGFVLGQDGALLRYEPAKAA
ncbi:MAG: photosynthesis system II assembly factor Ycf48 [Leptolyngbyaceae cyanobacterium SL_7_1]|nr:photosynthesis system II assembly factor Ycf48 [Leptolyngbyaceae cyanobacterium SL_7_1]